MGGLIRAAFCAAASALEFFNTLTSDSFEAAWLLYRLVEAPLVGAAFIVDIFCLDLRGLQSSALFVIASSTIPILLEQLPGPFLALLRFFVNFDGFKLKQSYDMAPLGPGCTCGSGSSVDFMTSMTELPLSGMLGIDLVTLLLWSFLVFYCG